MYGNIINRIMERATKPAPVVGMAATICMYSDRIPGTVVKVTPKQVHVQEDDFRIISGSEMDGSAQYEYFRNTNNPISIFRLTKARGYRNTGNSGLVLGRRERYYDPSF